MNRYQADKVAGIFLLVPFWPWVIMRWFDRWAYVNEKNNYNNLEILCVLGIVLSFVAQVVWLIVFGMLLRMVHDGIR